MGNLIAGIVVVAAAAVISLQFSVGDLMPSPTAEERDALNGFAEFTGVHCEWMIPSIYEYIKAGRPHLAANAVCVAQRQPYDPSLTDADYATSLISNFGLPIERFFKGQNLEHGLRMSGTGAPLLCYDPQSSSPWSLCRTGKESGCLFAKCEEFIGP